MTRNQDDRLHLRAISSTFHRPLEGAQEAVATVTNQPACRSSQVRYEAKPESLEHTAHNPTTPSLKIDHSLGQWALVTSKQRTYTERSGKHTQLEETLSHRALAPGSSPLHLLTARFLCLC